MTRRCSVMRMPVAAQRASMPVALSADGDFSAVMIFCLATRPVVPPRGRYDKSPRRLIIFLDLQEYLTYAAAGEMTEMRQQQMAGQATAAVVHSDGDR